MRKFRIEVYVPISNNEGNYLPIFKQERDRILRALCEYGGGATVVQADGIWADERTGRIYRDRIAICATDAEHADETQLRCEIEDIARELKESLSQEAIYVRVTRIQGATGVISIGPHKGAYNLRESS